MCAKKNIRTLLVVLVVLVGLTSVTGAEVDQHRGSFWYVIDNITEVSADADAVIWVTLPPTWYGQEVTVSDFSPEPIAIIEDASSGNRIVEWRIRPRPQTNTPVDEPTQLFFHYNFDVRELPVEKHGPLTVTKAYDRNSPDYKRYTTQELGIQTDGRILDLARQIAGDRKDPFAIGRLFYTWIMDNLVFRPNGVTEWDAMSINSVREGNCDQFSTLFVALCRSVGIPARTVVNTWTWGGRHVFAELMVPGHGWVPADATLGQLLTEGRGGLSKAEVEKILTEREVPLGDAGWVYGNLFGNRLIIGLGKNITIDSPTLGRNVTVQRMAPGGIDAHPAGYRLSGFNDDIVHGGFYVFDEQITEESAHVLAHQRLAKHFFRSDVDDYIEDACRQATGKYAGGVDNWINQGKSYLHKGEYYKAEAAFQRAMRLSQAKSRENQGATVWLHNYLGNCYDLLGQREMAIEQYNSALAYKNDFRGAEAYASRYLKKAFKMK